MESAPSAPVLLVIPLIASLAAWQACEIWRHGSIFQAWYAAVEARTDVWWCRLLACPFCLSNWVALLFAVTLLVGVLWSAWAAVPVLALAAARLANLGNDLAHGYCRTPMGYVRRTPENDDHEQSESEHAGDPEPAKLRSGDPGKGKIPWPGDGGFHS